MKIIGNDGKARYFRPVGNSSVKCFTCNTVLKYYNATMVQDLKSHICGKKEEAVFDEATERLKEILLEHKAACEEKGVGA